MNLRNLANELSPDIRRTYNAFLYTARSLINIENPLNLEKYLIYLEKNIKEDEEYYLDLQYLVKRKSRSISTWKMPFDINQEIFTFKK